MNKFEPTTEQIKKPEAQEHREAPGSVENSEMLGQGVLSAAEKEVGQFARQCAEDMTQLQERETRGLSIASEDRSAWESLTKEATALQAALENDIEGSTADAARENKKNTSLKDAYERVKTVMKKIVIGGVIASLPAGEIVNLACFAKDKYEWNSEGEQFESKKKAIEELFGEQGKGALEEMAQRHRSANPRMKGFVFEYIPIKIAEAANKQPLHVLVEKIPIEHNWKMDSDYAISGHVLEEVCNKAYPKGWVERTDLGWKEKGTPMNPEYGMEEGLEAAGQHDGRLRRLELYGKLGDSFQGVLSHEIAHGNDWRTSLSMNAAQKADLLLDIGKRLQSEDRFKSSYVEGINSVDKGAEFYNKAVEYWAEISEQFFTDPTQLPAEDFAIVARVISYSDPQFDVAKFQDNINDIIKSNLHNEQ